MGRIKCEVDVENQRDNLFNEAMDETRFRFDLVLRMSMLVCFGALVSGCQAHLDSPLGTVRGESPSSNGSLEDFVRVRGSLNPDEDVYFYFHGEIFLVERADPTASPKRLFRKPFLRIEGVNIARFVPDGEGGFRMLSREVAYYVDESGQVLDCIKLDWMKNPVSVLHIANDPVNFTLSAPPSHMLGEMKVYVVNASMDYRSPLSDLNDVEFLGGKTYQSTELFQFYAPKDELDSDKQSVAAWMSWSRMGQPLPWMRTGGEPSRTLIYHTRGYKVLSGYAALPQNLRELIAKRHPAFTEAPKVEVEGATNQTSWSAFREKLSDGSYERECQISTD